MDIFCVLSHSDKFFSILSLCIRGCNPRPPASVMRPAATFVKYIYIVCTQLLRGLVTAVCSYLHLRSGNRPTTQLWPFVKSVGRPWPVWTRAFVVPLQVLNILRNVLASSGLFLGPKLFMFVYSRLWRPEDVCVCVCVCVCVRARVWWNMEPF